MDFTVSREELRKRKCRLTWGHRKRACHSWGGRWRRLPRGSDIPAETAETGALWSRELGEQQRGSRRSRVCVKGQRARGRAEECGEAAVGVPGGEQSPRVLLRTVSVGVQALPVSRCHTGHPNRSSQTWGDAVVSVFRL